MEILNTISRLPAESLIPLFILLFLFCLFAVVLLKAHINPQNRFDVANFLRDETGKESSGRAFGFIALGIHSWWVATLVLQKTATVDHFLYYGIIWAGTPALMVFAQRWGGTLPMSPQGQPPYVPSSPESEHANVDPPTATSRDNVQRSRRANVARAPVSRDVPVDD